MQMKSAKPRVKPEKSEDVIRLRLSTYNGKISVSRGAYNAIGAPPYVQLLWDSDEKRLLLREVDDNERDMYEISPRTACGTGELCFQRINLIRALAVRVGWTHNADYTVFGEVLSDINMLAFRLGNAAECVKGGCI